MFDVWPDAEKVVYTLPFFVVTSPNTTVFSRGKCFSGEKSPARSVSYSSCGCDEFRLGTEFVPAHVVSIHVEIVKQLDGDTIVTPFTIVHTALVG